MAEPIRPQPEVDSAASDAPMRHLFSPNQDKTIFPPHVKTLQSHSMTPVPQIIRNEFRYPEDFLKRLGQVMQKSVEANKRGALVLVSINNLAMIVNAFGRDGTETVMREVMESVAVLLGPQDFIERIERDQIAVVFSTVAQEAVAGVAERIQYIISNYGARSSVGSLHLLSTLGVVDFPHSSTDPSDALDKSYIALTIHSNQPVRLYENVKDEAQISRQQMGLANYLRKAIENHRIKLAFQPVIESKTGRIAHYEALLRLIGEDGKISSAGALIPVAERMGLIDMIDHVVLDMVCEEVRQAPNLTLAFNVSNLTTDNTQWLDHLTDILKKDEALGPRLIAEITETAAQRDLRRTAYFVASLQEMGMQVALDDFGSGYTSFRQLKALSVDMVKIDGAFIKDLVDNADNRFFVKTLLDFTNGFGLKSVAEFVENGETAKMLMELGVHHMQGYYFGKPENHRGWLTGGEYQKS